MFVLDEVVVASYPSDEASITDQRVAHRQEGHVLDGRRRQWNHINLQSKAIQVRKSNSVDLFVLDCPQHQFDLVQLDHQGVLCYRFDLWWSVGHELSSGKSFL